MKKYIAIALCALMVFTSCGPTVNNPNGPSKTATGTGIGAGAGAVLGAVVGALISKDAKGAAIGAALGTVVGGGTGAIIGKKMDKKAAELAKELENAQVETVTDSNGLEAIKVTFDSGILFATNKSNLSAASQKELKEFANSMNDLQDTDIKIYGHTDNTGSDAVNERLSKERAESVASFLAKQGIGSERMMTAGCSYKEPVADNSTAEGRAKNRRVEIYIFANDNMVKAAQNGQL